MAIDTHVHVEHGIGMQQKQIGTDDMQDSAYFVSGLVREPNVWGNRLALQGACHFFVLLNKRAGVFGKKENVSRIRERED